MSQTNISWTARPNEHPEGVCKHGVTEGICLDVTCKRCWVQGYTVNPWIGCEKVSPACKHCYAEAVAENRMGLDVWGKEAPREIRVSEAVVELRRIDDRAFRREQRYGVFTGSMCDVFEDRPDLVEPRRQYLEAGARARHVDLMLLTKRADRMATSVPWKLEDWPRHIWAGVTAEDEATGAERLPHLAELHKHGITTFVSVEPMLGTGPNLAPWLHAISLVIIGGESGTGARIFNLDAARKLVEVCFLAGVAIWFKQMGSVWAHMHGGALVKGASHGQNPYRWPAWAMLHQLPKAKPIVGEQVGLFGCG